MSNKNYKINKARRQAEKQENSKKEIKTKTTKKFFTVLSVIIVVAVVLSLFGFGVIRLPTYQQPFTAPSTAPWGSGEQISSSSYGSNITIYYFSWIGCPLGATDSWAFYMAISSYLGNSSTINQHISLHTSNAADVYPNTPGLIFSAFHDANVVFDPIYVYNQTMTGTINNQPISTSQLVGAGMYEINASVPANVAQLEYHYMIQVPIQGTTASSFFHFQVPHVNTNIIITGPHGAWIFNGALYNPSVLAGLSPSYVYSHLSSIGIGGVPSVINAFKTVS
jgi:hypothetical protein